MNKRTLSPYRYDIVGSFLRPKSLKEARKQYAEGSLSQAQLTAIEDKEIIALIEKQIQAGLHAVTDGEFRRSWWHLDFFWGLQGVEKFIPEEGGYTFHGVTTRAERAIITGKISGENHPFLEHFKFLKKHTPETIEARISIPSPSQFLSDALRESNLDITRHHYPTNEALINDLAQAYGQVLTDLYQIGAKTVQFDDCSWSHLLDKENDLKHSERKSLYLEANNAAIAHAPKALNFTTHVCRGNYRSVWFSEGGYDNVATPLFDQENVNAYYLEYDSERAGDFAPLKNVTDHKLVVLGLITSKNGTLEDKQTIIHRIKEASQYLPLDQLCLSTQCGFASTEEGNELTETEQWAKIALVREIAEEVRAETD